MSSTVMFHVVCFHAELDEVIAVRSLNCLYRNESYVTYYGEHSKSVDMKSLDGIFLLNIIY